MNPSNPSQSQPAEERIADKAVSRRRAMDKIRSELNIEKWPAIWQPAKSKNKPALRVLQREVTAQDGSRVVSRVEVGYTQLGTLTTEEQKMLYVLIKLWEDSGKVDRQVFFSTRALARSLKKKGWGTNVITAITKSLRKLRTIPIEWINSYYDQSKAGAVIVDRRPFTLLGDLRIVERHQDGAVNSSQGYFKFDDHVLMNLQLNYTKPVCIEEFFKLRSEIAQLIYSHIDLMLFDKNRYERRTRELFDDLGLKNAEYQHMYERKRAIDKALHELTGIRLSSGVLKAASIEKTADAKDYKVVFSKSASVRLEASAQDHEASAAPSVVINDYSKAKDAVTIQAESLVRRFYQVFHQIDRHEPQSKETSQAVTLITQYGADQASFVVEYAHGAAAESNYVPQTFGGILHYTSRALDAYEREQKTVSAPLAPVPLIPALPLAEPPKQFIVGERRLAVLSQEQYHSRLQSAKEQVLKNSPVARLMRQHQGTKLEEVAIRRFMVEQLEHEPMDLLVLGSSADPAMIFQNLGLPNLAL